MTIEIREGRCGTIEVRNGDDALELASTFCLMHRLPLDVIVEPLTKSIEKMLHSVIMTKTEPNLEATALSSALLGEEDLQLPQDIPTLSGNNSCVHEVSCQQKVHGRHAAHAEADSINNDSNESAGSKRTARIQSDSSARADMNQEPPEWYQQLCEKAIRQVEMRRRELADNAIIKPALRPGTRRRHAACSHAADFPYDSQSSLFLIDSTLAFLVNACCTTEPQVRVRLPSAASTPLDRRQRRAHHLVAGPAPATSA
jgi:hypothetical protein